MCRPTSGTSRASPTIVAIAQTGNDKRLSLDHMATVSADEVSITGRSVARCQRHSRRASRLPTLLLLLLMRAIDVNNSVKPVVKPASRHPLCGSHSCSKSRQNRHRIYGFVIMSEKNRCKPPIAIVPQRVEYSCQSSYTDETVRSAEPHRAIINNIHRSQ